MTDKHELEWDLDRLRDRAGGDRWSRRNRDYRDGLALGRAQARIAGEKRPAAWRLWLTVAALPGIPSAAWVAGALLGAWS